MSAANNDLHLEDVEDFTSGYPPEHTEGEEGLEVSETPKRVGLVRGLVCANKKLTALLVLVFALVIAIISIVVVGNDEGVQNQFHSPLILINADTLDPAVTGPLMDTLVSMYDRNGLDASPLDPAAGNETPQRRAFFWMAHDNQNLDHTTKMHRYALAVFYYSTNLVPNRYETEPKTWYLATRWLTKANYCEWYGVECDNSGRVAAIEMERNFLSGALPSELRILEDSLYSLDFSSNSIAMEKDDFDAFLGLENLEELYLDDNFLEVEGLPTEFARLTSLEVLTLSYNLFRGTLEITEGNVTTSVFDNMSELSNLDLEANYFKGKIPESIGKLENLAYVYLHRNDLRSTLSFLHGGKMSSLYSLWLDGNDIHGTIPTDIGSFTSLASLSITEAKLTGTIPTEIGNAQRLQRIWLYQNELEGTIPTELANLPKLEIARLHKNKLTGQMPSEVCSLFSMQTSEWRSLTCDCKRNMTCPSGCCTQCF